MDIQTPQPELEPHKKWFSRHMILGYVFLGLVFAGIVVGAYLFNKNDGDNGTNGSNGDNGLACIQVIQKARNLQTGEVKSFPTPCDVPEGWEKINPEQLDPDASVGTGETADWKTYRNNPIGFELSYPASWKIESDRGTEVLFFKQLAEPVGYSITISSSPLTVNELIHQKEKSWGMLQKQERIQFAHKSATKLSFFGESGFSTEVIYISRGSANPVIISTEPAPYTEIDQILSTFKFIFIK